MISQVSITSAAALAPKRALAVASFVLVPAKTSRPAAQSFNAQAAD